jgi:hypothetical protein
VYEDGSMNHLLGFEKSEYIELARYERRGRGFEKFLERVDKNTQSGGRIPHTPHIIKSETLCVSLFII